MTYDFTLDFCGFSHVGNSLYIERNVATVTHDQKIYAYVINVHMVNQFKDWVAMIWSVDQDEIDKIGIDAAIYNAGICLNFSDVTA